MKILNPPVKLSASIIEFLHEFSSRGKECKLEVLIKHFGVSTKYLKLSLSFLSNNSLIIYPSPDIVTLQTNVISSLDKSKANSRKLVLEQFMKLQPFIEFTFFLGKGKSENESIKLVKSLYDIDQDESVILGIFKEWIRLLNIKISTTPFKNETLDGIRDSLQNKLRANNFIKEFLGNNLHNVSEQVITELSDAIKEIPEDNETSVNEAGRALEDFLRIDLAKDVNLTRCAGIAEIGNELNKYDQYPKKLNNLCVGLTNVRSMGTAHGSDKMLKIKWNITAEAAIGYIIVVLSVIKSYLNFKQNNTLIF